VHGLPRRIQNSGAVKVKKLSLQLTVQQLVTGVTSVRMRLSPLRPKMEFTLVIGSGERVPSRGVRRLEITRLVVRHAEVVRMHTSVLTLLVHSLLTEKRGLVVGSKVTGQKSA